MAQIYISHGSSTNKYAQLLSSKLFESGISWVSSSLSFAGRYSAQDFVERNIASCATVIVFLDKISTSIASVQQEIGVAFQKNKPIIAVRLYQNLSFPTTFWRHLHGCEWVDAFGKTAEQTVRLIMESINHSPNAAPASFPDRALEERIANPSIQPIPNIGVTDYIFLSYAHKNSDRILPVIKLFQEKFHVWYDDSIIPGAEWDDMIADKISHCGYMIAFISREYLESQNCKDELNYARDLDKKRILVFLDDVKLTGGMAMRFNRSQAIYLNQLPSAEALVNKLMSVEELEKFLVK